MSQDLFSVFDVAAQLNLHVKTVRSYVRDGRLKATRIGKQYRIARADLEALTGHPIGPTAREIAKRHRHVEVSASVQVDAISPEDAERLSNALSTFVAGHPRGDEPVRVETMYDRHLGRLKIVVFGGAHGTAGVLKLISALVED